MDWLGRQFSTRVIVLMPVAIAINIVLGYTVQTVLKLPIYLDSIGTILVGVLAGPIAGALTGILSNLIWQYAPGIGGGTIGPFAVVAGVIGFLAGIWGQLGVYRSRPTSGVALWGPAIVAVLVIFLLATRLIGNKVYDDPAFFVPWYTTAILIVAIVMSVAVLAYVVFRRDAAGAWVALAGALTGVVAALRQGGADVLSASLGQGFFSDPIDKVVTSFVVFVVLTGLSPRLIARFPLGERTVGTSGY